MTSYKKNGGTVTTLKGNDGDDNDDASVMLPIELMEEECEDEFD